MKLNFWQIVGIILLIAAVVLLAVRRTNNATVPSAGSGTSTTLPASR